MSYKISEKSNQENVIELLLQPLQPRSPWLNVQIDQRNPKNLVVKVKTADEISYILLTPFLNSHKEVNAAAVETDLAQFIASRDYGVALIERRVIRLDGEKPSVPIQPKMPAPVIVPKHMMGQAPKKAEVPGGKQLKREMIERRESEDAGLMAFGSAKRAEVMKMLEAKGVGAEVVPAQPKARPVPKLAAKSRLLNNGAPNPNPNPIPLPAAIPLPVMNQMDPETDEELDFALALSLQEDPVVQPPRIRFPSPPVQAPSPAPSPFPPKMSRPSPYNPEFLALQDEFSHSTLDLDAAYAAELEEQDRRAIQEQKRLLAEQEAQDAYMVKLLSEGVSFEENQVRMQREEHDRIIAAQIQAKERQRVKDEQDRLSREAIERIQRQDLIEQENQKNKVQQEQEVPAIDNYDVNGLRLMTQADINKRKIACEAYGVDVGLFYHFESLELPALDSDAHDANKTFVRNSRLTVDTLFGVNKEIMTLYQQLGQDFALRALLNHLKNEPEYKRSTEYQIAVDNVFGPYATKDKEKTETGGVSLKDMLVRIYVLLLKNADYFKKDIRDTRPFKFLKAQMTLQSSTCFEGAISRMFCAYFSGVWYYYDDLIGLRAKKKFSTNIPMENS